MICCHGNATIVVLRACAWLPCLFAGYCHEGHGWGDCHGLQGGTELRYNEILKCCSSKAQCSVTYVCTTCNSTFDWRYSLQLRTYSGGHKQGKCRLHGQGSPCICTSSISLITNGAPTPGTWSRRLTHVWRCVFQNVEISKDDVFCTLDTKKFGLWLFRATARLRVDIGLLW